MVLMFEKKLCVVQRRMTHYRLSFFESLKSKLNQRGIALAVLYGSASRSEAVKSDSAELSWGERLSTSYFLNERICWQPYRDKLGEVDMLVVTPENKLIFNLFSQYFERNHKVALWGHGANLQGDERSFREKFKRVVARRADWWFGYTNMSVPLIERSGFPGDRITVLHNSVDTSELRNLHTSVTDQEVLSLRKELGLHGDSVGVYLGSLYAEKRIPFLLESAERIRERIPDFELVIVGGGGDKALVEQFCSKNSWAHYLGVRRGKDKVISLSLGKVLLNPGLVGLGILDSFVCELPMITTDCGLHSPEIAYLDNESNGVMTEDSMPAYVEAVSRLLRDDDMVQTLKSGCASSARRYTVENMAENFANGVEQCLARPSYRWGR